ncbi:hypothetical protein AB9F42_33585 [Rhizobium leguminosarum]|uniref:hypothetical protein n=1 Tax=Rhizobium leguminosarum TaxID=384 RepID=UPI003F95D0C8
MSRWQGRTTVAAFVSMLSLLHFVGGTNAQQVEKLSEADTNYRSGSLPFGGGGAWRSRTQLVWNDREQSLVRIPFRVWDPKNSENLSLTWVPAAKFPEGAGLLRGAGTLRWSSRDRPSYEDQSAVAEFRGTMSDGMAEGFGSYVDRTGLIFSGYWRRGRMDGLGRITLPNGDQYTGSFKEGNLDGHGQYIKANGELFAGNFKSGEKDGMGRVQVSPSLSYEAVWREGQEIPYSRVASGGKDASITIEDDIRIGVLLDPKQAFVEENGPDIAYKAERTATGINIKPSNKRMMDVWQGRESIALRGEEMGMFEKSKHTFLGKKLSDKNVPIIFELENNSGSAIPVVGAYLQVASSKRLPQPAVHSYLENEPGSCESGGGNFVFENFGWASAETPKFSLVFEGQQEELPPKLLTLSADRDTFLDVIDLDMAPILQEQGVPQEILEEGSVSCPSDDMELCLADIRKKNRLGALTPFARFDGSTLVLPMTGTLTYNWKDADSTTKTTTVEFFSGDFPIAIYNFQPECGEGGVPSELYSKAFQLRAEGSNYRVDIPMADIIPPNVTGRWRIQLTAPETSLQDFTIVILLADGRMVKSQAVNLLLFEPKEIDPLNIAGIDAQPE